MSTRIILIILLFVVWTCREGYLILLDKSNAKGTTTIDKTSRLFNFLATEICLLSPLLLILIPSFNFSNHEILILTIIGTLFSLGGFMLRYVSIHILGRYFRTTVEIEADQKIIQDGPYKFIRHPSYSGIILFFIGYGILTMNWISFAVCLLLPAGVLVYRISVEEKAFVDVLGAQYTDYQSKTKKLIPFLW